MYVFGPSPVDPRLEVANARLSPERMEEDALRINRDNADSFVFCGLHDAHDGEHRMYRARGVHPAEVAALFGVASHDGFAEPGEPPRTERVRAQLEEAYRIAPFFPTWVDAAGFRCTFIEPVTWETALRVAAVLQEGLDGYLSDDDFGMDSPGDAPEADFAVFIHREQGIRLWWD